MGLEFCSPVWVSSEADKNRTLLLSIASSLGSGESDRGKSEPGIVMEGFLRSWGYLASECDEERGMFV
jgi:hypothetical protein